MYPVELQIKDTTESNTSAFYIDLLLSIRRYRLLHTYISIYAKRDHFNFHITNFPFLSRSIPIHPMTFESFNLYDTHGLTPHTIVSLWGPGDFPISYLAMDTSCNATRECLVTFWSSTSYSNFPTDQTLYQFYDLDTELDLYRLTRGFNWAFATDETCHKEPLALPDTWFRPLLGTYICSNC